MTTAQPQVEAALRRIRSLHVVLTAVLIGYIPAVFILYAIRLPELLIIAASVLLILFGIGTGLIIGFARCPSCNNHFHVRGMTGNVFVRRCLHCGVAL